MERPLAPSRSLAALVVVLLLLSGCASGPRSTADDGPPPLSSARTGGLELQGTLRGPLGGFGPQATVHAFLRADAALRAEIRYEPDDGPPVHEVLVWTPDTALLFDLRTGRFTDLGDAPGHVDAWGAAFEVFDATWLLGGRTVAGGPERWERRDDAWRGRGAMRGWRRGVARPVRWTELVWRENAAVRTLRTRVEAHDGATGWPRRLRVDGDPLEGPVTVDWSLVRPHEALGDSILDPLWEPPAGESREP